MSGSQWLVAVVNKSHKSYRSDSRPVYGLLLCSFLVARSESIKNAAIKADTERYNTPPKYEPVSVLNLPTTKGPTNPPKLPKEFIKPIDAAAVVPVKKLVGSAQNPGK